MYVFPRVPLYHFYRPTWKRRQVAQDEAGYVSGVPRKFVYQCCNLSTAPAGISAEVDFGRSRFLHRISRLRAVCICLSWGLQAGNASCHSYLSDITFFVLFAVCLFVWFKLWCRMPPGKDFFIFKKSINQINSSKLSFLFSLFLFILHLHLFSSAFELCYPSLCCSFLYSWPHSGLFISSFLSFSYSSIHTHAVSSSP